MKNWIIKKQTLGCGRDVVYIEDATSQTIIFTKDEADAKKLLEALNLYALG